MAEQAANTPLLSMQSVSKFFGGVEALRGVDFQIGRNEIVGLVGDNGAGKSTLIKLVTGVHVPTTGDIYYKGEKITIHSVKRSREIGIETVYQERALADQQTLWRNMFAGREITTKFGFLDVKKQKDETEKMLREHMGFTSKVITTDSPVAGLSGGEKQGIAISRALYFQADLIILDEPTMGLSLSETQKVQDFVVDIKHRGKSAIVINHSIYQVYPISDRFVIIDRGKVAGEFLKKDITQDELTEKMIRLAETGSFE